MVQKMKKGKRTSYYQVSDGELRSMETRDLLNMCCDCGLVHFWRLRVKNKGNKIAITKRVWRMERATAAARRGKRYRGLKLPARAPRGK